MTAILHEIPHRLDSSTRIHHLQVLLFFVDRHWTLLHGDLQLEVVNALLQFLSYDDASVQSWCFMCLAAIAHASTSTSSPPIAQPGSLWDAVLAHAMRRTNVPAVCRTACHVAHVLLYHAKTLLSSARMVSEIETFAKDLDVQGPSFPYDSVCAFIVLSMRIASRDIRLYRMSVEDKALTWLLDTWRPGGAARTRLPHHTIQDVLSLLGTICGSTRITELLCDIPLPDGIIATSAVEERATAVIRAFQLYARLPPFDQPTQTDREEQHEPLGASQNGLDHVPVAPQSRERRVSSFLLKTLDGLAEDWVEPQGPFGHTTAESVRAILDFAIATLCFEGALLVNGTQANRRTVQAACRILKLAAPRMLDVNWTATERTILLDAFGPLIADSAREPDVPPWVMLLPPGEDSGIRREILHSLNADLPRENREVEKARRRLQRAVLQSSDVSLRSFCELRVLIKARCRSRTRSLKCFGQCVISFLPLRGVLKRSTSSSLVTRNK